MLSKKLLTTFAIITVTLFMFTSMPMTSATPPVLKLTTDQQVYNLGARKPVHLSGNLTYGGSPVTNATVAIEVDNPKGKLFVLRTLNTGPVDPSNWPVEILAVTSSSSSFNPGDIAAFNVTVTNKAAIAYYGVLIYLTIIYSNKAPMGSFLAYNGSEIDGGSTMTVSSSILIPTNAISGNTTVYANAYNKLPKNSGLAYCPGKSAYFSIRTGGLLPPPPPTNSQFTWDIGLDKIAPMLGNYTVYATVQYSYYVTSTTTRFGVILLGDITGPTYLVPDGKVNMLDVALIASLFGKNRTSKGWVPQADLNHDGKINMVEVSIIANAFGITATLDP
jgi:hypothetical protein